MAITSAGAETIVIRPTITYTVAKLQDGVFKEHYPRLFSNGFTLGTYSSQATVARMEFRIPAGVRLGLQTAEFKARQTGLTDTSTGYTYLWYYTGVDATTTKNVTLQRSGFTARGVGPAEYVTRELHTDATGSQILQWEKLGLALSTNAGQTVGEVAFEDPQLIINYQPPPADNAAVVLKLLTEPSRPFEGQTDPAVVGFDADPDRDGMPNYMELWRGTNPAVADKPAPLEFASFAPGYSGPRYPWVGAEISQEGENYLLVRAEASHDMEHWRDISSSRQLVTINGKLNVRFTDSVPLGEKPATYFRFVAEPEKSKFSE